MRQPTLAEYMALIPPPNNLAEKFKRWLRAAVEIGLDTQAALREIIEEFDIDTAVGDQLDILGEILARPRQVDFTPGGGQSPILNDFNYRIVLKAAILKNIWKGTKQEIYDFWSKFFPESPVVIQDNQNMTMSVLVFNAPIESEGDVKVFGFSDVEGDVYGFGNDVYWDGFNGLAVDLILNNYYTPKPAGVQVQYSLVNSAIFGFSDIETNAIKGFGDDVQWINIS